MELCVQIAEHAEHLEEIRDDLARRKLLQSLPSDSLVPAPLTDRPRTYRTPEQTRTKSQYYDAPLTIYQPPLNYPPKQQTDSPNSIHNVNKRSKTTSNRQIRRVTFRRTRFGTEEVSRLTRENATIQDLDKMRDCQLQWSAMGAKSQVTSEEIALIKLVC